MNSVVIGRFRKFTILMERSNAILKRIVAVFDRPMTIPLLRCYQGIVSRFLIFEYVISRIVKNRETIPSFRKRPLCLTLQNVTHTEIEKMNKGAESDNKNTE